METELRRLVFMCIRILPDDLGLVVTKKQRLKALLTKLIGL